MGVVGQTVMVSGQSATLRVERVAAPWRDKLRAYKIVVDGMTVGSVADGASKDVPVEPGSHTLRIKLDWAGSRTVEFAVAEGQRVIWQCLPNGGAWSAWRAFFSPRRYIGISPP
jgi:hypothetical protein